MSTEPTASPNLTNLLRELRDESITLLRQEVALAKAEMKENASNLMNHSIQIAIGGFVSYAGAIVLLIGIGLLISSLLIRAGMSRDLAQWLAPSCVGLVVAVIGGGMAARAKHAVEVEDVVPKKTVSTLQKNKDWAQSKVQHLQ